MRSYFTTISFSIVFGLTILTCLPIQAQTFSVIHSFGGQDGRTPYAGLTIDRAGNLYGATYGGGADGAGTVFKLAPRGSGWIFNPLYSFHQNDGSLPSARVIFGPDGSLYGTTFSGGIGCQSGCGTVFKLRPPATACKTALCPWTETVLYRFTGGFDGQFPESGDLVFDEAGNIYGTTYGGGTGNGVVFELTPSGTESVLYAFPGGNLAFPYSGVIFDNSGNLYGTTPNQGGALYQLTPSGAGWTEQTLYSYTGRGDGYDPFGGLIFDRSGDIYGTTNSGGINKGGTAFKVASSNGMWTLNLIYSFTGVFFNPHCGPYASLVLDGAGNLYGTTMCESQTAFGSVFKLTNTGGSWTYTSLHDFTGGSDGAYPTSNVVFDTSGNLYGTASAGGYDNCAGSPGCGVVWEVTP
jgi:uncharacterized repeat protein (TIGR03803 family)